MTKKELEERVKAQVHVIQQLREFLSNHTDKKLLIDLEIQKLRDEKEELQSEVSRLRCKKESLEKQIIGLKNEVVYIKYEKAKLGGI